MAKECTGENIESGIDNILNETEESIHVAAGKGIISQQRYDKMIDDINAIREKNNKLKCLLIQIPDIPDTIGDIEQELG